MKHALILSIDQGTTSSRALLFSATGNVIYTAHKPLTITTPHQGWVEQNPQEIWETTRDCIKECIQYAKDNNQTIAGIGITNQRETTILWDKNTGKPLYNAIVWQDRRTAEAMNTFKNQGHDNMVREKTGLILDPYFSASKINWIIKNTDDFDSKTTLFGTIDTYLIWHLTGGRVHATDATNASRTLLYNIHEYQWDDDLCALFEAPIDILPDIHDTRHNYGDTDTDAIGATLSILACVGDQQGALIGQNCFNVGDIKSTYGTGCFMVMNTGDTPIESHNKLLTTIGYRIDGKTTYALEGSIFTAGSIIQWLRDGLGIIDDSAQTETLAQSVDDNDGVYIVPALTGLGAPHWKADATGMITGITRGTTKAHIARAALEAQAYQTHDLIDAMRDDSHKDITAIRADGGLATNGFAMQFMADILNIPVHVPENIEATAWGAAKLAALGAGLIDDMNIQTNTDTIKTYEPDMNDTDRKRLLNGWHSALKQIL